tara:strand:- start:50515 stop:50865 length:351 start_codon:yes stop_codon:yes gene_type:complete
MLNETSIREHMEVTDSAGTHLGTVDHVENGRIKLTRNDSADNRHHYVDMASVERIEGDRVILRNGATAAPMTEAEIAAASEFHTTSDSPLSGAEERPLFGTSGTGTGMGGSGSGQH